MPAERDERARLLQHIESAQSWYRTLVDTIPDAVLITDRDARCLDGNPAAVALIGVPLERLRGMSMDQVVVNPRAWIASERERLRRDGRWRGELDLVRADGERVPVEVTATVLDLPEGSVYLSVLRDLREHRREREALARQEQERQLIVENAADFAMFSMDLERRVTSWNHGAERILGYSEAGIVGKPADLIFTPEDRARGVPDQEVRSALEKGRAADVRWHLRSDGVRFWGDGVLAPLSDEGGALRGFFKILRDATREKRAEDAMRQAQEALETRVRERTAELQATTAELVAISYSISHDLQAPLRAIHGYADTLREELGARLDPGACAHLARIVESASRMDALIRELLAYSQLGRRELTLTQVPPRKVVDEAVFELEPERNRTGARITVDVDPNLPPVRAHRATLNRAIVNLMSNAIKFVKKDTIPDVTVRAEQAGNRVRIWVEDRGIGIAPEHHERIFRVFERLHSHDTYPGTGVGLAMVRRSIERMGGAAGVESAPGRGSRFWIELPVAGPAPDPFTAPPRDPS